VEDEEAVVRGWIRRRARVTRWLQRRNDLPSRQLPLTDPATLPMLAVLWWPLDH